MMLTNANIYGHFISHPILAKNLFENLSVNSLSKLSLIKREKSISKGKNISRVGIFPQNIYVLRDGKAQMTIENGLNRKSLVRLLEAEEVVGLTQFVSNCANEMKISSLTPCLFEIYPTKAFLTFLLTEPQVCFRLASLLSLDIQSSYQNFITSEF